MHLTWPLQCRILLETFMRVKILEKATITHALFFFSFCYKFSYLAFSDLMLVNFDPFSTFLLVAGSRSGWGFLLIEWNSLASSNLLVPFHLLFQHSQAWFAVFILPQRDIGGHQCWYTDWNWGILCSRLSIFAIVCAYHLSVAESWRLKMGGRVRNFAASSCAVWECLIDSWWWCSGWPGWEGRFLAAQVERDGSLLHLQRLSSSLSCHEVTGVPTMLVLHWIRVHKCQSHSRSLQFLLMSLSDLFRVFSETSLVCPAASSY